MLLRDELALRGTLEMQMASREICDARSRDDPLAIRLAIHGPLVEIPVPGHAAQTRHDDLRRSQQVWMADPDGRLALQTSSDDPLLPGHAAQTC
jgi:hypothetical protein